LKPEPDHASPLVYEKTPSFINIPIAIKLKDIENQINKFMTGLIFEKSQAKNIVFLNLICNITLVIISILFGLSPHCL